METTQGRRIGNVGVLDLRTATEATVGEIKRISNAGVVIYSPETAYLLPRLNIGNMGSTIEISGDVKMRMGPELFSRDSFKNQPEPLNLLLMGPLTIQPDVPASDIEQGLGSLVVAGPILCPEHLAGAIESKIRQLAGPLQIYHYEKLIDGNLTLDQASLHGLEDNSEISLTGKLLMPELLPNDLLSQKIRKIEVFNKVVCREENAPTLLPRLDNRGRSAKITIVPTGFELVQTELQLDAALIETLPNRKLYCTNRVQIEADVEANVLDQALESLISTDLLICPAGLKRTIARKCNLLNTQAIFYNDELWLNDTDLSLSAARFDYLQGKATLVNFGDITIASDVEPKTLADWLDKVHNFGDIFGTPQQLAALQARLGTNEGDFITLSDTESGEDSGSIGNVGHLKL